MHCGPNTHRLKMTTDYGWKSLHCIFRKHTTFHCRPYSQRTNQRANRSQTQSSPVCVCVCFADQPTPHHQNTKSAPIVVAYRFARYSIFHCINLCYAVLSCSSVRFWMFMLFSAMFLDHFPFLRHASTFGHTLELSSVANCIWNYRKLCMCFCIWFYFNSFLFSQVYVFDFSIAAALLLCFFLVWFIYLLVVVCIWFWFYSYFFIYRYFLGQFRILDNIAGFCALSSFRRIIIHRSILFILP